ncbi:MAG TPA: hypothetical protein VKK79_07945, partial [Candidatus Lokiarchaeia archaeon]|nr:hypothetical protein [Candidatus Lokiarchaeia archaeon]
NSTGSVTPSEVVFAIIIIAGITIAVYGGVTSSKCRSNVPSQQQGKSTVTYLQPAAYVADIKFCRSCGGKIRTHLKFCNLCGAEQ